MSLDGSWNIVLKTPIGDQASTLTIATKDGALSGSLSSPAGAAPLRDGKAEGNKGSWKADITQPVALTLEFSAEADGDRISGNAKLGVFGNASFSGTRA